FFDDPHTANIYTLSLHDALPILNGSPFISSQIDYSVIVDAYGTMTLPGGAVFEALRMRETMTINGLTSVTYQFLSKSGAQVSVLDRKSTRLNSSHVKISYAVFCL